MWCRLAALTLLLTGLLSAQDAQVLKEGMAAMQAGQFEEALSRFNRLKEENPRDARIHFLSGLALYRLDQVNQAMHDLERAVELDSLQPQYVLACAEVQVRSGYRFKAVEQLKKLAEPGLFGRLTPRQLWELSDLAYRTENPDLSLQALSRYKQVNPKDERIPFRLGQLYLSQNDLDAAEKAFESAVQETSRKAEANYGVGLVRFQKGELEKARPALEAAVAETPDNPEYVHMLSTVLLGLGEAEEALVQLLKVEGLAPDFPLLFDDIARAYVGLGEREKAREYRERFIKLDKATRDTRENAEKLRGLLREGRRLLTTGKPEEARIRFEEAVQLDPEDTMARGYLVGIYISHREWELAEKQLSELDALDPDSFETLYLHSTYLYATGSFGEALKAGERAKAIQPGFSDLRNLLGNIQYALGDFDAAVAEYDAAVSLAPEQEGFRLNLETARRKAETP